MGKPVSINKADNKTDLRSTLNRGQGGEGVKRFSGSGNSFAKGFQKGVHKDVHKGSTQFVSNNLPAVETHVGADIRSLRKSRGMTLTELCEALGRSVGWASQVERGQTDPSIPDLKSIAAFFKVPVGFFFRHEDAPENERGWIVRSRARATMGSVEDGLKEELLSPDISGEFEMIRSVFAPGAKRNLMPARETQDGGYIISGELEITVGEHVYILHKGDSFQFDRQPYGWHNKSNEDAVVIWIISPPNY